MKEILICEKCNGRGVVSWEELVDHHKGEYETHTKDCKTCDTTGRVIKETNTTVKIIPFSLKNWAKR